jgi:hypothetical protein
MSRFKNQRPDYEKQDAKWKAELSALTNEQLVDVYHRTTGSGVFTTSHHRFLSLLKDEFKERAWDASALFDAHPMLGYEIFRTGQWIIIENNKIVILGPRKR